MDAEMRIEVTRFSLKRDNQWRNGWTDGNRFQCYIWKGKDVGIVFMEWGTFKALHRAGVPAQIKGPRVDPKGYYRGYYVGTGKDADGRKAGIDTIRISG